MSLLMQQNSHVWLPCSARSTRQSRKVLSWCLSGKTTGALAVCWKEGGALYRGNQSVDTQISKWYLLLLLVLNFFIAKVRPEK